MPRHRTGASTLIVERLRSRRAELDLTQAQRNQIRERSKSRMSQLVDVMWPLAEAHHELKRLTHSPDADETSIRDAADSLGDAIAEVAVFKSKVHQDIREVLTPEQMEQFKELCSRHPRKGRHGRHHTSRDNDDNSSGQDE